MNPTALLEDSPLHEVITFYSYKGGTGRTMALANTACLLASAKERSLRVLAIDWDLEAPGLHYYLRPQERDAQDSHYLGVVEYFTKVQAFLNSPNVDPVMNQDEAAQFVLKNISWRPYCHATRFKNVDFMPAGCIDSSYQARLAMLDWHKIYQHSPGLFRCFAGQLAVEYDVVLVDSRTGMNDSSGICTSLLPDKLVVVFTPNRQSLSGIENLVRTSVEYRQASRDLRPLMVYPLPSRIDAERDELRQLWRYGDKKRGVEGYQPQFERIFRYAYSLEVCDLSTYCNEVQVQHSPDYSYGEDVAATYTKEGDRFSIVRSYQALLRWVRFSAAPWETPEIVQARHRLEILLKEESDALADDDAINWSRMAILQTEILLLANEQRGPYHQETISIRQRLIASLIRGGEIMRALELLMVSARSLPALRMPVRVNSICAILESLASLRAMPGHDSIDGAMLMRQDILDKTIVSLFDSNSELDHPSIATLEILAKSLRDTALPVAMALQQALVKIQEIKYGDDNPATLMALSNLAITLKAIGDPLETSKARAIEEKILKVRFLSLGENHPETLEAMANLADSLRSLGDLANARKMQEKVLSLRLTLLGDEHEDALAAMANLAATLRTQGDLNSAKELQQRVLDLHRRKFGDDHPDTIFAAASLAATLKEQGDLNGARALLNQPNLLNSGSNKPVFQGVTASGDIVVGDRVLDDKVHGNTTGVDKTAITGSSAEKENSIAVIVNSKSYFVRQLKSAPWRVFLSSTSELREFPQGGSYINLAERAVSAAGHAIVDLADFPATDSVPAAVCQQRVRECDVLLGIYGLRYGSPVRDNPEVSYTELEFLTASEAGLPRLIFVVDADSEELGLPPRALIDPDYGDRQGAFMRRVKDSGIALQVFRNPEDLGFQIEQSLHHLDQTLRAS